MIQTFCACRIYQFVHQLAFKWNLLSGFVSEHPAVQIKNRQHSVLWKKESGLMDELKVMIKTRISLWSIYSSRYVGSVALTHNHEPIDPSAEYLVQFPAGNRFNSSCNRSNKSPSSTMRISFSFSLMVRNK
jgi:hypothetical protein